MSNSMFVPLLKIPCDINEVNLLIKSAFNYFNFDAPKIWLDIKNKKSTSIIDGFVMVEGEKDGDKCWVSISKCAAELVGDNEFSILVDVKTRGNWKFASIVAYAFCKFSGHIIFNDAGELDGQESYTPESLEKLIRILK